MFFEFSKDRKPSLIKMRFVGLMLEMSNYSHEMLRKNNFINLISYFFLFSKLDRNYQAFVIACLGNDNMYRFTNK